MVELLDFSLNERNYMLILVMYAALFKEKIISQSQLRTFYRMKEEARSRECGMYGKRINNFGVLLKKLEWKANFSMNTFITQPVLQQVHQLLQSAVFGELNVSSFKFQYSLFSLTSSSSCLRLLLVDMHGMMMIIII